MLCKLLKICIHASNWDAFPNFHKSYVWCIKFNMVFIHFYLIWYLYYDSSCHPNYIRPYWMSIIPQALWVTILISMEMYVYIKDMKHILLSYFWALSNWWQLLSSYMSATSFDIHSTYWGQDKMATFFRDNVLKGIFLHENVGILIKILLKSVPN